MSEWPRICGSIIAEKRRRYQCRTLRLCHCPTSSCHKWFHDRCRSPHSIWCGCQPARWSVRKCFASSCQKRPREGSAYSPGSLCNFNQTGECDGSALLAACRNGFIAVVKMLLHSGADPNLQSGIYGNSLQAASSSNQGAIVELLLERGAQVNAVGGLYHTALIAAAHQGHEKIVEMLLDAGADLKIEGEKYGSALDAATANGQTDVMNRLRLVDAPTEIEVGVTTKAFERSYEFKEIEEVHIEQVEAEPVLTKNAPVDVVDKYEKKLATMCI